MTASDGKSSLTGLVGNCTEVLLTDGALQELAPEVQKSVQEWLEWDPNATSRAAVQQLVTDKNAKELSALFHPRIAFGTAGELPIERVGRSPVPTEDSGFLLLRTGLRARMAPGYANMNELVVLQASQGLCKYMLEKNAHAKEQGIVIGSASQLFRSKSLKCVFSAQIRWAP